MAVDKEITNTASGSATSDGNAISYTSNTTKTTIKDGIIFTKIMDLEIYRGVPANITITLENKTKSPVVKPIFVDVLDNNLAYITNSVKINGVAVILANVTFVGGTLTVKSITDLAAGATMTCTFQVLPS